MADLQQLKQLRNQTQASIADCRIALDESNGDYKKALEWIKKRGLEKAAKKEDRETSQGLIEGYIHQTGRVGAMVELLCETDFVARTDEFKKLAREVAMQVAAMNPENVKALLEQEYIRDPSTTIEGLIKQAIGKIGENIIVKQITRFEIGKE